MSQNYERYVFNFKIVYTERTFQFSFHPNVTIQYFTEFLEEEFSHIEPNKTIEIVEAGQYHNINGRNPELAPKINYCETNTLEEVYGNRKNKTAFYIRLIDAPVPDVPISVNEN